MSHRRQVPGQYYRSESDGPIPSYAVGSHANGHSFETGSGGGARVFPINDNGHAPSGSSSIVYASQSHLNNNNNASSSASTSHTGGGVGDAASAAAILLNSTAASPSTSPPAKIGIYGWRKRCLYLLILVVLVVAILNLALTVWIIRVVHLTVDGLGPMEIGADSVRVSGDAEFLGAVHVSEIRGAGEAPLVIESTKELKLRSSGRDGKEAEAEGDSCGGISLAEDRVRVSADDFWVKNCAGETLLRARADAELEIGAGNGGVNIVGEGGAAFPDGVATSKITAPPAENLEISSRTNRVDIFGARGVEIAAKSGGVSLRAVDDVTISSKRGKVKLDADIELINLPLVENDDADSSLEAYQLCICENGRLFLVGARDSCAQDSDIC